MLFKEFIHLLHSRVDVEVSFKNVLDVLNAHHAGLGEIDVYPVQLEPPTQDAIFRRVGKDRTSPYGDEFWNIQVMYCDSLDQGHPKQRRFVLTKEVLHVFDDMQVWTSDREKFVQLLKDIQNQPLAEDHSQAYSADMGARWPALIALCPLSARNNFAKLYHAGAMEDYEIAARFGVPIWTVPFIVDDYFLTARQRLLE